MADLAVRLENGAEAAKALKNLTDGCGVGGGGGAHIVKAEDAGEEVKLTKVEELLNAGGDGGGAGTVGRAAVFFERSRIREGAIEGCLIVEERQAAEVGG